MTATQSETKRKPLIRKESGDPSRPRRKMPNTRWGNISYAAKLVIALPFFPLWPVFISLESRDPYYVIHYFETFGHCFKTFYNAVKNRSILRLLKYNWFSTLGYVEEQLGSRIGACTRCAKCCKMLQCDYLAYNKQDKEYYCSVYNTPYWVFGSCGRYPIDQSDVEDYNCPGFTFPEAVAAGAQRREPLLTIGRMPGKK